MSGGLFAFVPGVPRPQGSKNAFNHAKTGKVIQVESSRYVRTWRDDIRGVLDMATLRRDYDAERSRVDRFISHLTGGAR